MVGKDWKSCEFGEIGDSEPLWWEKIGKVANQAKLAIFNKKNWKTCYISETTKFINLKPLPLHSACPKTSVFPIPSLSDHYFPVKTEVFFLYQSQFCSVNIFLILSRKNASKLLETPALWFWGVPNLMEWFQIDNSSSFQNITRFPVFC